MSTGGSFLEKQGLAQKKISKNARRSRGKGWGRVKMDE